MSELKAMQLSYGAEIERNPKFNELELKRLLISVIEKTPTPTYHKVIVSDHNDSPNTVKTTRIRAGKYDRKSSKLPLYITLKGEHEKWILDIYPTKTEQQDLQGFASGIKMAAALVEEDENRIDSAEQNPSKTEQTDSTDPEIQKVNDSPSETATKNERRMTSRLLTDDMIISLLVFFADSCDLDQTMKQLCFLDFVKKIIIDCQPLAVVRYFVSKKLLELIPIPRKPKLRLTDKGRELLLKHHEAQAAKEALEKELEKQVELVQFPQKALPTLTCLRGLKKIEGEYQVLRDQIRTQKDLISQLEKQVIEETNKLSRLEKQLQTKMNGILLHLEKVKIEKLSHLIELAEENPGK